MGTTVHRRRVETPHRSTVAASLRGSIVPRHEPFAISLFAQALLQGFRGLFAGKVADADAAEFAEADDIGLAELLLQLNG